MNKNKTIKEDQITVTVSKQDADFYVRGYDEMEKYLNFISAIAWLIERFNPNDVLDKHEHADAQEQVLDCYDIKDIRNLGGLVSELIFKVHEGVYTSFYHKAKEQLEKIAGEKGGD
ncbi:MAG: hypothetical protein ACUZ8E_11585 [Candidatus Anammoxibacter sp.]